MLELIWKVLIEIFSPWYTRHLVEPSPTRWERRVAWVVIGLVIVFAIALVVWAIW